MNSFRIATCNVANFNSPGVRFADRPGSDGDPVHPDLHAKKVAWLSGLLDAAKVDLVALQELFHKSALADLMSSTARFRTAAFYAPELDDNVSNGEARGPFCGLLTRFPIVNQQAIVAFPDDAIGKLRIPLSDAASDTVDVPVRRFKRAVLRVEVQLRADTTAIIFVAHLKSKRGDFLGGEDECDPVIQAFAKSRSLIVRAAEAAALRSLILAAARDHRSPIIVMGDLNDDLSSVTTQIVAGEDPFFGRRTRGNRETADRLFYSVHDLQERFGHRNVSYSHIHGGRYDLLDHIFVSQDLVSDHPEHIAQVLNTRMYNDHVFDARGSAHDPDEAATSDHGIPVTEIAWR